MKYKIKAQARRPSGFWRCGVRWPGDAPIERTLDLSSDELDMIMSDAQVVVLDVSEVAPAPSQASSNRKSR